MPLASAINQQYSDSIDYTNKNPNMGKTIETKVEYKKSFKNSKRDTEIKKENPFGSAVMDEQQKEKLIKEKLASLSIIDKNNETQITKIMKNENKDMEYNRKSPNQ
jgi:hypothetical protein